MLHFLWPGIELIHCEASQAYSYAITSNFLILQKIYKYIVKHHKHIVMLILFLILQEMYKYIVRHHKLPAKTAIENNVNLTPLTLASKLGRHTIFKEMLELGSLVRSRIPPPPWEKCQPLVRLESRILWGCLSASYIFEFTYGDRKFVPRIMAHGSIIFFCYRCVI